MSTSIPSGSSLGRRALAALVLLVATYVLFKVVIGIAVAVATFLAVIVAIAALIWAIRVL
ncbi:MAG: hypothetical protein WKF42_01305 [Solirubrobacteraceae bacterium]